mmetsp:Transcript_69709/g.155360  ORF Transcript_69709/g.155360 Transcript_69709/m.155360 type:complete len:202 (+) Transcript_69709:313-918(+)
MLSAAASSGTASQSAERGSENRQSCQLQNTAQRRHGDEMRWDESGDRATPLASSRQERRRQRLKPRELPAYLATVTTLMSLAFSGSTSLMEVASGGTTIAMFAGVGARQRQRRHFRTMSTMSTRVAAIMKMHGWPCGPCGRRAKLGSGRPENSGSSTSKVVVTWMVGAVAALAEAGSWRCIFSGPSTWLTKHLHLGESCAR